METINENVAKKLIVRKKISNIFKNYKDLKVDVYKAEYQVKEFKQKLSLLKSNRADFVKQRDEEKREHKDKRNQNKIKSFDRKIENVDTEVEKVEAKIEILTERLSQNKERIKYLLDRAKDLAKDAKLTNYFQNKKYVENTNIMRERLKLIKDPKLRGEIADLLKQRVGKVQQIIQKIKGE